MRILTGKLNRIVFLVIRGSILIWILPVVLLGAVEETSENEAIAEIIIKEPLVVGLASPFEIVFVSGDRKSIDTEYQLEDELVFKVDNAPFNIFTCLTHISGKDQLSIPLDKIEYSRGIVRGEIALERIHGKHQLTVYQRRKGGRKLKFLGSSVLNKSYTDIAEISFSNSHIFAYSGNEIDLGIVAYNYLGEEAAPKRENGLYLRFKGDDSVIVDGVSVKGGFFIKPYQFRNGAASIQLKMEIAGRYVLEFSQNQPYIGGYSADHVSQVIFDIVP